MKPHLPAKGIRLSSFILIPILLSAFIFTIPRKSTALPSKKFFNTAPVAVDDHAHVISNGTVTASFIQNDSDPDGDSLSLNGTVINTAMPGFFIQRVTTQQGGSIVFYSDGNYTYTPPVNFTGSDQVNYEVCDVTASPLCSTATIYIDVRQSGTVLSIQISSFSGIKTGNDIFLQWTTATENNYDHFEIQHSANNSSFIIIASVKATGNSNTASTYSFLHKNTTAPVNYYRIKLVKKDGNSIYSKVIAVKADGQSIVLNTVYPVPFREKLELTITTEKAGSISINLYDMNGKLVIARAAQCTRGLNTITLNGLNTLQPGNYFMDVNNANNILQTKLYKAH